jgi:hypothetical protein
MEIDFVSMKYVIASKKNYPILASASCSSNKKKKVARWSRS